MSSKMFSLEQTAALLRSLEPLRDALLEVWPEALRPTPLHDGDAHFADRELLLPDGDDARGREAAAGAPGEGEALRWVSFEMETPRDGPGSSRRFSRVLSGPCAARRRGDAAARRGRGRWGSSAGEGGCDGSSPSLCRTDTRDIVAACALYRPDRSRGHGEGSRRAPARSDARRVPPPGARSDDGRHLRRVVHRRRSARPHVVGLARSSASGAVTWS